MANEGKDLSVSEKHHQPSEVSKALEVTNRCIDGEITPKQAFEQLAGPETAEINPTETPIEVVIGNPKQEREDRQEIADIRQEIKIDITPTEPLVKKDEYYLQKESVILETKGAFIDSHTTQYEKNISNQKKKIVDKISSVSSILKLKTSGVKNATDFYNVLNQRGFSDDLITHKKTVDNFKGLSASKIALGIDRINKLGFTVNNYDIYNDTIKQSILEASNIPDDKFDNVCSELNPYFFLNENGKDTSISDYHYEGDKHNPFFKILLETAKNGQLDPEVKHRLDLLKETIILGTDRGGRSLSYFVHLNPPDHRYMDPNPLNIFNTDNKITFTLPEGRALDEKIFDSNFKLIYQNIDSFLNPTQLIEHISQEQISQLPNNENGVADFLKRVYTVGQNDRYSTRDIIDYVARNQDKIHSSFNDESQRSQFLIDLTKNTSSDSYSENSRLGFVFALQKIGVSRVTSFPDEKDRNYWEIISNTKNSDLIRSLVDNKDQLFDENNYPKPSFFETIIKSGESVDYYSTLGRTFLMYLDDDSISKFPIKDKVIWTISRNIFESSKKEDFLSKIDELSELINQSDGINPKFLDKVVNEYGERCLRVGVITDEVLETLPPQDKVFWKLYKDLNGTYDGRYNNNNDIVTKLFEDKNNFSQFFDENNNLNSLFFEKMAREFTSTNDYKDIFNTYLTQENIDKLNDQDKVFWTVYKSFSLEKSDDKNNDLAWKKNRIQTFLIDNKNNFNTEYLNQENKLTSSFMMAIVKGKDFNITEFKPLLDEYILDNLVSEDRPFWKSYIDADSYNFNGNIYSSDRVYNRIREILLENKDDYRNFFDSNSNPTSFLFESATNLNKSENIFYGGFLSLANVSDEAMANFLPQDKIFWTTYRDSFWLDTENQSKDQNYGDNLRYFLLQNHSDFSKFIDQDFKLNSLFLESIIQKDFSLNGRFLTEEKLSNFSSRDKKSLEIIRNNNRKDFNKFIINHKDKIDDLFDDQNNPTFLFYKTIASEEINLDSWKNLLTPEQIANFPENDQRLWGVFKTMVDKKCPNEILNSIIKNQEQFDLYFDKSGNPTQIFLELILSKNKGFGDFLSDSFVFTSLINPEIIKSFPQSEQRFWNLLIGIDKKFPDDYFIRKFIFTNKNNINELFTQDNKPTALFFREIIIQDKLSNDSLASGAFIFNTFDSELIKTFSESDQNFLNKFDVTVLKNISANDYNQESYLQKYRSFLKKNIDSLDTFFDENNKPTSLMLEKLAISDSDYYLYGLLSLEETTVSFSKTDQDFWKIFKRDIPTTPFLKDILLKNKDSLSSLYTEDLSVTLPLLKLILKEEYNPNLHPLITESFIKNRPESEQKFWLNISNIDSPLRNSVLERVLSSDNNEEISNNPLFKLFSQENPSFISLDKNLDIEIGNYFSQKNELSSDNYLNFPKYELKRIQESLLNKDQAEIDQSNWKPLLMLYIQSQEVEGWMSQDMRAKIETLFNDPKTKNLCLQEMQNEWKSYLDSGKPEEMQFSLKLFSKFVDNLEGAGPLSQIESLSFLINSVDSSFSKKTTAERTKIEILNGLSKIEERFVNNRWSNEDKTVFYNISRDVINAAPSLFSDYLTLFDKLSPSELISFSKDVYPLYKTKLVLIEKTKGNKKYFEKEQLLELRKDIRSFTDFNSQKEKLLEEIKEAFANRFEIIKTPDNFTAENIKSLTNVSTYLSNLHSRTPQKEAILGFYLSVMLNNRWDDFRSGQEINPREYLSESKSAVIEKFLKERKEMTKTIIDSVGIENDRVPEFIKLLQSETQNVKIGDVETIDIKLNNIIQNLNELQDLDLYPDLLDKQRMQLLQTWGNKGVGSTVAKMYQQLSNPEKNISLSESEIQIRQQLIEICQTTGLDFKDPQVLKENFQDGIRALATLVNMSSSVEKINAVGEIETLRKDLEPSKEIIEIFQRLGEDFKVSSGAMALSQDLDYLDNLVVKKEDLIKPEEREVISEYIATIKTQVLKLEEIYDQIKNKFENLKQGNSSSHNELLNEKLKEIDKIINSQSTQQIITSTATNNLNVVIENIRACLSCTEQGCNNDTDLTFGDINKFYLYSQSENQAKGSISDQLVYLEPITRADGSNETSFVFDNLYGLRTPSILENQVEAVVKKSRAIKQNFPDSKISIFISNSALSSSGSPKDRLLQKFKSDKISANEEEVVVDVIESAAADHYIEIGGGARTSGKRKVGGIILTF